MTAQHWLATSTIIMVMHLGQSNDSKWSFVPLESTHSHVVVSVYLADHSPGNRFVAGASSLNYSLTRLSMVSFVHGVLPRRSMSWIKHSITTLPRCKTRIRTTLGV